MRKRTVYKVWTDARDKNPQAYEMLLPNEFYLIKMLLKNGITIHGITKEELTPEQFKYYFG